MFFEKHFSYLISLCVVFFCRTNHFQRLQAISLLVVRDTGVVLRFFCYCCSTTYDEGKLFLVNFCLTIGKVFFPFLLCATLSRFILNFFSDFIEVFWKNLFFSTVVFKLEYSWSVDEFSLTSKKLEM